MRKGRRKSEKSDKVSQTEWSHSMERTPELYRLALINYSLQTQNITQKYLISGANFWLLIWLTL